MLRRQVPEENVPGSRGIPARSFDMLPKDPSGSNHDVIPYGTTSSS
ncbi:hypothetical protein ACFC1R_30985 [Kitasatospora sp. NPDC056138]